MVPALLPSAHPPAPGKLCAGGGEAALELLLVGGHNIDGVQEAPPGAGARGAAVLSAAR